jgi:hypothetical protein
MTRKYLTGGAASALLAATMLAAAPAQATEGGGLGPYADGLENFAVGALPPPGVYTLVYTGAARYDRLRDDGGHRIGPPDFKISVGLVVPRVVWIANETVAGGQLAFHSLLPLLDVKVTAGGASKHSTGAGDAVVGAGIGWHHSQALHSVAGVDVYLPTGSYSTTDPSSLGKHHWTIEPVYAVSLIDPAGLNADMKVMWDINGRNHATDTRSGQAVHADFDAGWGFGNGWAAGASGYVFEQVGSDSGPNSAQGKSRAMALGPSVRYLGSGGLLVTAKFQKEFAVRNRPEGTQFYVKATLPF